MDKRTLFFVIALSLTLFGVNQFFDNQNLQKKQEWLQQQQMKNMQKEKLLQEDIHKRTASLQELPVVEMYLDQKSIQPLTYGVYNQQGVLALAWEVSLPKTLFIQSPTSETREEYHLAYSESKLGTPALYRLHSTDRFQIAVPSEFGQYDLQILYFTENLSHSPKVALGQYVDGHFSLLTKDIPSHDSEFKYRGIALLKGSEDFFAVGLYNSEQTTLTPLNETSLSYFLAKVPSSTGRNPQKTEEIFYVLETPYQQLVFSNYGGALAEINLPFKSKENELSVVREIQFDRDIVEDYPYNAYFPAHAYYTPSMQANQEWVFHEQGVLGGYYPLLRRNLIEKTPRRTIKIKPQHYALNIISEYPELAELIYTVKQFDTQSIMFEAVQNNRKITKTFSLRKKEDREAPYCLDLDIKIEGEARNFWLTSGVPEVEWISAGPAPTIKYRITRNYKSEVEQIDLPKDTLTSTSTYLDWICNSNGFLGMILDPLKESDPGFRVQHISGLIVPSRLIEIGQDYDRFKSADLPGYMTMLPLKGQGGHTQFRFFAGPFDSAILKQIDAKYTDQATGYNPDYIACQTMHGWFTFISEPFAKFLFVLMNMFHYITNSWALSIILLTVCLRIMLYPLNTWSTKSMVRMQQISPEVTLIQQKYKKDPKKAQLEIMNLYREKGVNPASGCLPLLIQMPFLIGMFDLLKSSFALRGASFIPGWIDDLTAPDVLFSWNYPIFFIGTEFHLLPILLGAVMFFQQRLMSTAPKDPQLMTDQQRQQRSIGTMMTGVFAIMFYNFPSGLNIYWLFSMLLGMIQQWFTTKKMQTAGAPLSTVKGKEQKK
jgi:YidC/Oxa1 family membrane protein insertase